MRVVTGDCADGHDGGCQWYDALGFQNSELGRGLRRSRLRIRSLRSESGVLLRMDAGQTCSALPARGHGLSFRTFTYAYGPSEPQARVQVWGTYVLTEHEWHAAECGRAWSANPTTGSVAGELAGGTLARAPA
ncbi:hypothetical protein EVG20_g8295 [Dentipellis fragilis]|uniref:Uncharacterized protein n=1 Tax=Dentipellis fragilis TaxID=205917 RepID=A0A4Y9YB35_9AGAM|nr:hypothetical protein EVG20_g8295 [Dentipellis fragilis]